MWASSDTASDALRGPKVGTNGNATVAAWETTCKILCISRFGLGTNICARARVRTRVTYDQSRFKLLVLSLIGDQQTQYLARANLGQGQLRPSRSPQKPAGEAAPQRGAAATYGPGPDPDPGPGSDPGPGPSLWQPKLRNAEWEIYDSY